MDFHFIFIILTTILLVIFLCIAAIYTRLYLSPLKTLPGPKLSDILFGEIGRMKREDGRILEIQKFRREKYGRIRKNHLPFGEIRLDVSSVDWAKYILSTNAKNYERGGFAGVSCLRLIVGHSSLLFISGDIHKRLRKIANPAFKVSVLKTLMPVIVKCTRRLTERWEKLCVANSGKTTVLAKEFLSDLTLDVIGLAAFGFDFKASLEQSDCVASAFRLLTKGEVILVSTFPGFSYITSAINFIAKFVGPVSFSLVIQILYWVDQMHKCVVRNIVNSRNANNRVESEKTLLLADSNENSRPRLQNLLDCMISSNEDGAISDSELQDMIMTFIVAGHETSSIALSWLLLNLAEHSEWQTKCRQEIISNGVSIDMLSWDEVFLKFPTLKACMFESLRLFPPAPYLNRKTLTEDNIAGYQIPPKTDVLVLISEIHRDPEIWPNPDEFQPERFLDEKSVPIGAFMPFGDGVHKCIGYKFALAEVAIIAAMLLEKFEFGTLPNCSYREKATVTLVPAPELELTLRLLDIK